MSSALSDMERALVYLCRAGNRLSAELDRPSARRHLAVELIARSGLTAGLDIIVPSLRHLVRASAPVINTCEAHNPELKPRLM